MAYFHAAENRPALFGSSNIADIAIAALAVALALIAVLDDHNGVGTTRITWPGGGTELFQSGTAPPVTAWVLVAVVLTTAPLAVRRKYPISTFCVILVALIAGRGNATAFTFGAAIFAAYSAVVYSRHRVLALFSLAVGAVVVTTIYPNLTPPVEPQYTALLVLLPTVAVGNMVRAWQQRAGSASDQLRRAEAEHEAATQRALALERARIASELHDVVTHNVSMMVVQAGAARRVLGAAPDEARSALLAIEESGREAITELQHMLGLLAQPGDPEEADLAVVRDTAPLRPQPGLDQVRPLIDRVTAAGLPAELRVSGTPRALPPGMDLAAYRVIQEALTNVIKHAGQSSPTVTLDYTDDALVVEVTDNGALDNVGARHHGGPSVLTAMPGGGHGLLGLRERVSLYGGELDAGSRPEGGWRVRARFPEQPSLAAVPAPS